MRLGLRPRQFAPCVLFALAALFNADPAISQGDGGSYVSPQRMEDEYFNAIDRVEGEYGPYATELSDLYLGLGQALLNTEDYEQALDAFSQDLCLEALLGEASGIAHQLSVLLPKFIP